MAQDATNQLGLRMALDPNARKVTIPFPGGSITATRGLLNALFGAELVTAGTTGTSNVSVGSHQRVRVIGGPAKTIAANTYARKKFPSARSNGGSGGEPVAFLYGGDWWTARLTGSHQDLCSWLEGANWASNETILWRSEKGTKYGPFTPSQPAI